MVKTNITKLLLVDDDPDIQVIVTIALEGMTDLTLQVCSSGYEALERLQNFHPDLILLDAVMPDGLCGLKLFEELRKSPQTSFIPIVYLTARAQKHEIEQYKKIGAIDVISKPFDPIALEDTLNDIWQNYREKTANSLQERLQVVRRNFINKLPDRIDQIVYRWNELQVNWNTDDLQLFFTLIHNIVGSGKTFSFSQISDIAYRVESILKPIVTNSTMPGNDEISEISIYIKKLKTICCEIDHTNTLS